MAYRMDGAPGKMFPEIPFHPREQNPPRSHYCIPICRGNQGFLGRESCSLLYPRFSTGHLTYDPQVCLIFGFLHSLNNWIKSTNPSFKVQSVLKNPKLFFIFANLMTLPMFEQVKPLTFHKLKRWHYIVPC